MEFLKLNLNNHILGEDTTLVFFTLECFGLQLLFIVSRSILEAVFWSAVCWRISGLGWACSLNERPILQSIKEKLFLYIFKTHSSWELVQLQRRFHSARQDINGPCCLSLSQLQKPTWIKQGIRIETKIRDWNRGSKAGQFLFLFSESPLIS